MLRIVFFGTPELAVPCLAAVAAAHEVTAVVCQPDKPKGRGKKLEAPPVKVWAEAHGIPVVQPEKLNDGAFEAWLREQRPDVCVLAAYGRILKQPILDVPHHGFLNLHPSLLPKHRGASPIRSAILEGADLTGVTIIRLSMETDAGDILLQKPEPIRPEDDAETLTARLADKGAALMVRALELVESGNAVFTPQDHAAATYTKMFNKEDGRIRWERPAREIHNLVRAAVPWPVAQTGFRGEVFRILKTEAFVGDTDAAPGTVVEVQKDRLIVTTGVGTLAVLELQAPGKKAMPVEAFLRGHRIEPGERFEDL
jgi:methionyl-tRNA formyltransferase